MFVSFKVGDVLKSFGIKNLNDTRSRVFFFLIIDVILQFLSSHISPIVQCVCPKRNGRVARIILFWIIFLLFNLFFQNLFVDFRNEDGRRNCIPPFSKCNWRYRNFWRFKNFFFLDQFEVVAFKEINLVFGREKHIAWIGKDGNYLSTKFEIIHFDFRIGFQGKKKYFQIRGKKHYWSLLMKGRFFIIFEFWWRQKFDQSYLVNIIFERKNLLKIMILIAL